MDKKRSVDNVSRRTCPKCKIITSKARISSGRQSIDDEQDATV